MTQYFFITGTDTGVGKTEITCALQLGLQKKGFTTKALKPVAAGCTQQDGMLKNLDALALMASASLPLSYEQVNPIALKQPASPHIAAKLDGKTLSVDEIIQPILNDDQTTQVTLVEGAGGWLVPINDTETLADFASTLKLPVILVVGLRLGCLNHALLSAHAIEHSKLKLVAWIGNQIDPNMDYVEENHAYLTQRLKAPCLGKVPHLDSPTSEAIVNYLDLNLLNQKSTV